MIYQFFLSLMLVFVLQWLSLHWEILIILFSQFLLTFHHIHKGMSCFITLLMAILVLIGMVFKIFKLSASAAASEFCIPVVVLNNCGPELFYILAELFNKCLKESCFPDCWKVLLVVPVFMLGKGLQLKTTALLIFFLWLIRCLKNL